MKQFFKSTIIMSIGTLLSRITGFFRDIFIAKYLGSGFYSDIFFMAFKIPNFFRKLFAEGAFNSAFTPIFASGLQAHGKEKITLFARNIYSILLYFLLIFTIVIEIAMPYFMYILAPGFLGNKEKLDLLILLTRITFPYLIFISLVSLMSGILNSFNKFFAVSIMPIILNVIIIFFSIIFGKYSSRTFAIALSYAVLLSGILQLFWILFFTLKEKVILYPVFPRLSPTTKQFFSKFSGSLLGSGIVQINSMVDAIVATLIPGAVSLLYYGDRVAQFPLSLIGTAIGISVLPILSKTLGKRGNKQEAQEIQENSIFLSCFLGIPSAVGLLTLANPIIEVLFQRGEFSNTNTIAVANILKIYAIALPFFILSKIFQTTFYAKKDTKTPMKNSLFCLIINIIFSLSLVFIIGVNGIAIATTISSFSSTLILFRKLIKDNILEFTEILKIKLLKILYISVIMGIVIVCCNILLDKFELFTIFKLIISGGIGSLIFLLLSIYLKILNLEEIKSFIFSKHVPKKLVNEANDMVDVNAN